MCKTLVNNGINYQLQLVVGFLPSTVLLDFGGLVSPVLHANAAAGAMPFTSFMSPDEDAAKVAPKGKAPWRVGEVDSAVVDFYSKRSSASAVVMMTGADLDVFWQACRLAITPQGRRTKRGDLRV